MIQKNNAESALQRHKHNAKKEVKAGSIWKNRKLWNDSVEVENVSNGIVEYQRLSNDDLIVYEIDINEFLDLYK